MWVQLIKQQTARLVEQAEANAQLASLSSFLPKRSFGASASSSSSFSLHPGGATSAAANPGTSQELAALLTEIAHAGAAARAKFPPRLTVALGLLNAHATFTRRLNYVCEMFVAPLEDISKGDPTTTTAATTSAASTTATSSASDASDTKSTTSGRRDSSSNLMGTTTMLGAAGDFMRRTVKVDLQALLLKPDMLVFLQVKGLLVR
jgi:hypothetical protein